MNLTKLIRKIKLTYDEGRLTSVIKQRLKPYFRGFRFLYLTPFYFKKIRIHSPDYRTIDLEQDKLMVERIFNAYKKMRKDQGDNYKHFKPSTAWQNFIETEYSILTKALEEDSLKDFYFFLTNFGAWKKYQGIENTVLVKNNNTFFRRMYLKKDIFLKQLKIWKWITNETKSLEELSYPMFGNQVGAFINGVFVGVGSFFNDIYGSLLDSITSDIERPIIADLGGGYGKLAYFTLRKKKDFCFIDFDLPEVLTLASFYLMKVFPDKKVLLYGEGEYNSESSSNFDLIFMPPWEIENVGENSIDLFINKNSLGEMTKDATIKNIHYICKSSKYFFHMNHEKYRNHYDNNESSLLNVEYPIDDSMKLLFRYPDLGHLFYQGNLDYSMDIFLYLYEKKISI